MKDRKSSARKTPQAMKTEITSMQSDANLGRDIQSKIGDQLRAMYDDVVSQGVPDRFADRLKRLDKPGGGDRT